MTFHTSEASAAGRQVSLKGETSGARVGTPKQAEGTRELKPPVGARVWYVVRLPGNELPGYSHTVPLGPGMPPPATRPLFEGQTPGFAGCYAVARCRATRPRRVPGLDRAEGPPRRT